MTPLARALIRGIVSGFLGRGVSLVTPLLVMGPMLSYVGDILFGTWLTAVSIAAMATFLGFGINNALLTRLSEAFGTYDLQRARRLLGQGYVLSCSISFGLILLMFLVILIATNAFDWHSEAVSHFEIIGIVFTALLLSFPSQILDRLLQAQKKFVQAQILQATGSVVALILSVLGIAFDVGPIAVFAIYSLAPVCVQILWSGLYFSFNCRIRPMFKENQGESWSSMFRLGGEFFIVSILLTISMNIDNAIIAFKFGVDAVTEFGVPARLGSLLMMFVLMFFSPLWPIFGDALARKDKAWIITVANRLSIMVGLIVLALGFGIVVFADQIMSLWMNRNFDDQQYVLMGMTSLAFIVGITSPHNMLLNAAGKARQQILPWALFLRSSVAAKFFFLTPETVWWTPWITSVCYAVLISPIIMRHSRSHLR